MLLKLSVPPSLNNCFINVPYQGRIKSKQYRAWIDMAGWELLGQRQGRKKITGPVSISIVIARPSVRSDIDNRIKPILDLLVTHDIIPDDRHVISVSARWADKSEAVEGAEITIVERLAA
jgi:Holliday junction resolvase RusA-like endonuclease